MRSSKPMRLTPLAVILLAVILLTITGTSLHGQTRSRSEETLEWWNHIGKRLIAMAKDLPEDKYDCKVHKGERTFPGNLLHVAAVDYDLIRRVSRPHIGPDFGENSHSPCRAPYQPNADVVQPL